MSDDRKTAAEPGNNNKQDASGGVRGEWERPRLRRLKASEAEVAPTSNMESSKVTS